MHLTNLSLILAEAAPAAPGGQPGPPLWTNLVPLVLLMVVFYFILLRPQQKKAKEHAELMKTIRSGDRIVTSSGIVGVVVSVKEKTVSLRSADSKFEITKASVGEILERSGESSES